ncbi:MAG TPA: hypothetical protein VMV10_33070 [Pirellulales bacterium]|nr:hypothetical protein [Pirellulales bacterium]
MSAMHEMQKQLPFSQEERAALSKQQEASLQQAYQEEARRQYAAGIFLRQVGNMWRHAPIANTSFWVRLNAAFEKASRGND